jgi:hypothetical protein
MGGAVFSTLSVIIGIWANIIEFLVIIVTFILKDPKISRLLLHIMWR